MLRRTITLLTILFTLSLSGFSDNKKKNPKDDPDTIGDRKVGDGVNSNDVPYLTRFPFEGTPHAGYDHTQREGTNGRGSYPNSSLTPESSQ